MSQSPQPLIRGALRQTPLAEFLVQAYDGGLDGTLLLQTPERQKSAIYFLRGAPAKARPAVDEVEFGDVAVDLGLIPRPLSVSTRKRAHAAEKSHELVLREEGHLDETGLFIVLREQLFRQVLRLSDLPDTTGFGFYKANYLSAWGTAGEWRVKPLPMVWRALADHLPAKRRQAWADRLGENPLKIRSEAPVSRYGLTKQEKGILDMLRAMPASLEGLCQSGVGSPEEVQKVAVALLLTRQLDVGSSKEPLGLHEPAESPNSLPPPSTREARRTATAPRASTIPRDLAGSISASRPPRRTSTTPQRRTTSTRVGSNDAGFRQEVEAFEEKWPNNHYEMLGVAQDADVSAIRTAFFQLARRWHPDRLPEDMADLKPTVTKAFAAMGEAHQTLSDDKKRAEYTRLLDESPEDEQAQVAQILSAASAFQHAEVLMKKKDFVGALQQAKEAYEGDSSQADYIALYAWLQGTQRSDKFEDLISMLDSALKANGDNVRALWYRSQLLKKAGQTMRAVKDFKKIIDLKPNHVEAKRELRVYTMRKRSDQGASGASGLFGRFRKKD